MCVCVCACLISLALWTKILMNKTYTNMTEFVLWGILLWKLLSENQWSFHVFFCATSCPVEADRSQQMEALLVHLCIWCEPHHWLTWAPKGSRLRLKCFRVWCKPGVRAQLKEKCSWLIIVYKNKTKKNPTEFQFVTFKGVSHHGVKFSILIFNKAKCCYYYSFY